MKCKVSVLIHNYLKIIEAYEEYDVINVSLKNKLIKINDKNQFYLVNNYLFSNIFLCIFNIRCADWHI